MNRLAARVARWTPALISVVVALQVPVVVFSATNGPPRVAVSGSLEAQTSLELVLVVLALTVTFTAVGSVILRSRPENTLGWLFALLGVLLAVVELSFTYSYRAIAVAPGSLPWPRVGAWIGDVSYLVLVGTFSVFVFLLFPDGRLRTRAQRRTAVVALVGIALGTLGGIVEPELLDYVDVAAPLDLGVPAEMSWALLVAGYVLVLATTITAIALLVRRQRRAVGRERDQLRLLIWASVSASLLFLPSVVLPYVVEWAESRVAWGTAAFGVGVIPVSVGVAIVRHRLLDIDLVIRRTVVVAVLGAFITAVYVGVVVGVGTLVGNRADPVLSAAAAALVAVAFQPARRWARRLANRMVFGDRATPYEVMQEFAERVAGSYGTDDVLPRMATILGEGTGAERAQVWLRIGDQLRPVAAWPDGVQRSRPLRVVDGDIPPVPDVSHAAPVRDGTEVLGALTVTKPASDPVSSSEERLVEDLAHQAALVLRNVRLVEDLRASRQRLVAAQDQERRRLERDIHDGAQQQLVALAVKVGLADRMVERDPAKAHELLADVQVETTETLEALRDLARGIYPPLLADRGLAAALEAQARKAILPVRVETDGLGRYPQEIEATVYFCVLEALQNAAKYAQASRVEVSVTVADGALRFEVADDGRGFARETASRGAGLQNMTDRLDAVGGSLEIRSAPGEGTRVRGRIPVP